MSTSVIDVTENILSKKIDKNEALENFKNLSDDDQKRLIGHIRSRISDVSVNVESVNRRLKSAYELSLTEEQKNFIEELTNQFENHAPKSKANALKHQDYFVDQRKTAGLKKVLKSVQYQLTYERAEGAYLYDIDGNRYIDITGDNGVNLFGHQPEFMKKALMERMNNGYPLVGYSEDLFEAARLIAELTGHDRVVFAQSGTESVMWAVRIARAATLKKKIVLFDGSYHGLSDAVLAFKDRKGSSMAAGLGMLQEFADQLIILDYGDTEQLQIIQDNADDIACVLVEPVQSRFPNRQPIQFLRDVRQLTLENNITLIFDEMITGFRAGCRGAEGFYNVKPDISTYGKVAGGGMPTGLIAGAAKFMDYVDGGTWSFEGDSMPKLKRTFLAGTHTQNPLKVAACLAIAREMKNRCKAGDNCNYQNCFLSELNEKTELLSKELNQYFESKNVPIVIEYFSSLFRFNITDDEFGITRELLIVLLKLNGIETSTSGNCFLTTEHSDGDIRGIIEATQKSVEIMLENNFFLPPTEEELEEEKRKLAQANDVRVVDAPPAEIHSNKSSVDNNDEDIRNQLKELILTDLKNRNSEGIQQ